MSQALPRTCHHCANLLTQAPPFEQQNYQCQQCQLDIPIGSNSQLVVQLASGLFIGGLSIYFLLTDVLSFAYAGLQQGLGATLIGLIALIFTLALLLGALLNLLAVADSIILRRQHPLVTAPNVVLQGLKYLALAAVPWLLAIGLGFANDLYLDLDESLGVFLLPLIFSPLWLAAKKGLDLLILLVSCFCYPATGLLLYFILD